MNTSEVLNKAADLIERRGWTSGSGWEHENGGPLCLEGGILAATGSKFGSPAHHDCPAYKAVRAYLADRTDKSPWQWNDRLPHDYINGEIDKGRYDIIALRAEGHALATSEVIGVLRACAVIEASRESESAEVSV